MVKSWKLSALFVLAGLIFPLLAAACASPASPASLGFVVGTGTNGADTKVHNLIYPGQRITSRSDEIILYVPANSRNYIINDGRVKNANGDVVGDRSIPITAYTKTGTVVTMEAKAFWTLNQARPAMYSFYDLCFKYQCASRQDVGGDANFSTKGWNGMLAENFGPAMEGAARIAVGEFDDSVWQRPSPTQYQAIADGISKNFAEVVRKYTGYREDLFCGSGNSKWSNPDKPGEGEFTCSPVRFIVDKVQRGQVQENESTESVLNMNVQRLQNAQALYGQDAGYWLGLQDTIDKCKGSATPCIVNIGGTSGGPAVTIPESRPAPKPTATPEKR